MAAALPKIRCLSKIIWNFNIQASSATALVNRVRKTYYTTGGPGSGAGKGGGAGGSIKESGGGLGRYGAAQEEGYFYLKEKEQIEKLKKKLKSEPQQKREEAPPKQ